MAVWQSQKKPTQKQNLYKGSDLIFICVCMRTVQKTSVLLATTPRIYANKVLFISLCVFRALEHLQGIFTQRTCVGISWLTPITQVTRTHTHTHTYSYFPSLQEANTNDCFVPDRLSLFAAVQTGFTGVLTQRQHQPHCLHTSTPD